jgi:hypothetical protein
MNSYFARRAKRPWNLLPGLTTTFFPDRQANDREAAALRSQSLENQQHEDDPADRGRKRWRSEHLKNSEPDDDAGQRWWQQAPNLRPERLAMERSHSEEISEKEHRQDDPG